MKKAQFVYLLMFGVFAVMILIQAGCSNSKEEKGLTKAEQIQKGKYLVNLGGCNHCHSPKVMTAMGPVPDTTKLLSGHPQNEAVMDVDPAMLNSRSWLLASMDLTAWIGPWGISYTANLTPDPETGLGDWTEDLFIKTLRSGKHMGVGRPILPPMPAADISRLTDEDLKAVFAYLHSIPAVKNQVPAPVPPDMVASLVKNNVVKVKPEKVKNTGKK